MLRRHVPLIWLAPFAAKLTAQTPRMHYGDATHLGRPFAKDPSVIRFGGRYLLYYTIRWAGAGSKDLLWAVGVAESSNLTDWKKIGEIAPSGEYEKNGFCAPFATVVGDEVHLFYQSYGNGRDDAICHAVSKDGLRFTREATNPIFRPTGAWNAGRAIDAEAVEFKGRWFLYAATRDPEMKVQMLVGAVADAGRGFGRGAWRMISDAPLLKPELPWETNCIEAPSVVRRGDTLYMFYAGGYNNDPQQVGCARSQDGIVWTRISSEPLLANGKPGEWNSSESGHPCAFVDEDGQTYLFFQGNNDKGHTWYLSFVKIGWREGGPYVIRA